MPFSFLPYILDYTQWFKLFDIICVTGNKEGDDDTTGSRANISGRICAISSPSDGLKGDDSCGDLTKHHPAGPLRRDTILRHSNAEHCLKTKRRVLKMLIVVVLEFFICWTPLYVVNTLSFFAPKALYEGLGYTGISLVQLLAQASCCCNPITYCFMSSSFRRAFVKAFGWCSKKGVSPTHRFASKI